MLQISENRRFLMHDDGTPFFYLADTAWELFHRLSSQEAEVYLRDRAAKGFTVIQAVVLAELDGLTTPNALGDLPLLDNDPARPNESYFAYVDTVVELATSLGLHIALLPTWGDKWNLKWGVGPVVFTPENAYQYALFLGRRYANNPSIIWILGGDRPIETDEHRAIINNMAQGLREGDGGTHLFTYHPWGGHSSSEFLPNEEWLSFHMWQSGHKRNTPNYEYIARDYARQPVKPCMDGEPIYEDIWDQFDMNNGVATDYDVRKPLYWGLFAGAHGHTYGCHAIWQFWQPNRVPNLNACRPWQESLHLPGAGQVRHARALLTSRPFFTRIPDQSLIVGTPGEGVYHVQATRDEAGSYALLYLPAMQPVTVDLSKLAATTVEVTWCDPRTGTAQRQSSIPGGGEHTFTPPPGGPDWVLVLDDAVCHYPLAGTTCYQK